MTSTLSPHDTGDIRLGDTDRDSWVSLRRPDATGEQPAYQPQTIGIVDRHPSYRRLADVPTEILQRGSEELARLQLGETLILPVDAVPAPPRHAAPTVYLPGPAVSLAEVLPQPDVRPPGYRGARRKADPPWAWALIGAGTVLAAQAVAFVATVLLSGAIR